MAFSNSLRSPRLRRSLTWPLTGAPRHAMLMKRNSKQEPMSATTDNRRGRDAFLDDLEDHPEDHFLSPIIPEEYEYEDWSDDSDFDDEVEWDAGITDFALFDDDRQRSEKNNTPVSSKWNDLLSLQASALRRAEERNHASSTPRLQDKLGVPGSPPALTPDTSPHHRDDVDYEPPRDRIVRNQGTPSYLTIIVTPPTDGHVNQSDVYGHDDDVPLSFFVARKQAQTQPHRRLQRPGLRHTRTMSGKVHAWKRPSGYIYTVGEERDAEEQAEVGVTERSQLGY